ncbi:portal protein [Achromobacter marplatensis]|uniref:portal protein n=1 Tax=Achromobacter marplatensis TaxID=470868 RepID=UPI00027803E2|nr:hypothetical protein [Achromobacter marplatensis]EJO31253.1 hypothetical protein QWC_12538 [Achromobacter marplatensis]
MNVRLATLDGEYVPDAALATSGGQYDHHLDRLVRDFEAAEEGTRDARLRAERNRDYYDGKQLTTEEIAALKKRGQPPVVVNYIKRKIEILRGLERRSRTDPKAFPRNPQDEQGANAATDALRFVADENDFDVVRSSVYENMMIEGYGGADIVVEEAPNGDVIVSVQYVPWDRLVYDPHSRKSDFSDARYRGIVIWMDKADAMATYPDREDAIEASLATVAMSETYDDRPKDGMWSDNRRTRVRIVQMHYQDADGTWMVATFTRGGFLVDPQVSPYVDKYGQPTPSLIMRSCYIDRENNRYGAVSDWIDTQDEINKRRSKALHLLNQRQTYGTKEAVQDVAKAKRELARPDGHVELNGGATFGQNFGILPTGDMAAGQMQLLQQVTAEMQASGPNASLAGKDQRQLSGRAIQSQQQAGSIEVEPTVDELRQWTRDVYEAVWLRIKQFWTDEKWVRVTDDERNIKWVGLNKTVTVKDRLAQLPPQMQEQALMLAAQQFGLPPQDPALLEQPVAVENDVSGLDVDIVIEEGPDLATLQGEQFEQLAQLAQSGVPIPPKAIIQASSLRNKDQILDEMEAGNQLPPQVQQQIQAMQQQLQQQGEAMQQMQQQLRDKQADLAIKATDAETRRMAVMKPDQQQPVDPVAQQVSVAKDVADIRKANAQAQQTEVETALLVTMPTAPEFRGSVSI